MIEVKCSWCGSTTLRYLCDIKHYKHFFCNITCKRNWMVGQKMQKTQKENHWNWRGGRGKSFAERHYPVNNCELCGSIKSLDRHHKDKNQNNNIPENIQILCRSCHEKLHRGGEKER